METVKIIIVLGILASGVAVGFDFVWSKLVGGVVTSDEIVRHAILSFVLVGSAIAIVRRRPKTGP